jgi:hypothetical protein
MAIGDELARLSERAACEDHISELQSWLRDHSPRAHWTQQQVQAYGDRIRSLAGWLAKAQLLERSEP